MDTVFKENPEKYAKCSKPYATYEEAVTALHKFQNELQALREKYQIPNVFFVLQALVEGSIGGKPRTFLKSLYGYSGIPLEILLAADEAVTLSLAANKATKENT